MKVSTEEKSGGVGLLPDAKGAVRLVCIVTHNKMAESTSDVSRMKNPNVCSVAPGIAFASLWYTAH